MLVTDTGRLIRIPVHDIRIAGRNTQGVTLFDVEPDERVVSVAWVSEQARDDGNGDDDSDAIEDSGERIDQDGGLVEIETETDTGADTE